MHNRWDEIVATGDVPRAVLRRFDHLTEVLGLDRQRAIGWTLGRVLQNALWDIEDGRTVLELLPGRHRHRPVGPATAYGRLNRRRASSNKRG